MEQRIERLLKLERSLTGGGVDDTFQVLKEMCDFDIYSVASGTQVFDWTIPDEWSVKRAYIEGVVSHEDNPLHLVNYSRPFSGVLSFDELKPHIYTHPNAIPYKTTYYKDDWGFCMTEETLQSMDKSANYNIVVDTKLSPGVMKYGLAEYGQGGKTYLFSTYSCHPLMANDNVSGMVLWALLNQHISQLNTKNTYKFLIAPETIGALTYLQQHEPEIDGAFVLTCVGGEQGFSRKRTFEGMSYLDTIFEEVFNEMGVEFVDYPFDVRGSDERQFSSPAYRIPTTSVFRSKYYEYPEYHTSADNKINLSNLMEVFEFYKKVISKLEDDEFPKYLKNGEPMLGRRNLYDEPYTEDVLWFLFHSDGRTSTKEISKFTGLKIRSIETIHELLKREGLVT